MRIIMLIAVIVLAVAFLGAASVINGVNVQAWFIGGMLAWAVDAFLGDWVATIPRHRVP
jgi:hypothetical protein